MIDKPVTFTDCTGWAADALNAALRDAGKPAARDYITIAEQWMNLARMVPQVPQQYFGPYPAFPPPQAPYQFPHPQPSYPEERYDSGSHPPGSEG